MTLSGVISVGAAAVTTGYVAGKTLKEYGTVPLFCIGAAGALIANNIGADPATLSSFLVAGSVLSVLNCDNPNYGVVIGSMVATTTVLSFEKMNSGMTANYIGLGLGLGIHWTGKAACDILKIINERLVSPCPHPTEVGPLII